MMGTLLNDLHFGVRGLRRNPGFAAVAILTLALGIGANTALFSVVNGVLLSPVPYPHPEQLLTLQESKPNFETGAIPYLNFVDWQNENHTFSSMAISRGRDFTLRHGRSRAITGRLGLGKLFRNPRREAHHRLRFYSPGRPIWRRTSRIDQRGSEEAQIWLRRGRFGEQHHLGRQRLHVEWRYAREFRPSVVQLPAGRGLRPDTPMEQSRVAQSEVRPRLARNWPSVTLAQAKADLQSIAQNLATA